MPMMTAVRTVFRRYTDFTGTAPRSDFWWFALFSTIVHGTLQALDVTTSQEPVRIGSSLSAAFGVAVVVPTLAVTVRRLRDAGRSWKSLLWFLLPVAGLIVLIVQLAEPTQVTAASSDGLPTRAGHVRPPASHR